MLSLKLLLAALIAHVYGQYGQYSHSYNGRGQYIPFNGDYYECMPRCRVLVNKLFVRNGIIQRREMFDYCHNYCNQQHLAALQQSLGYRPYGPYGPYGKSGPVSEAQVPYSGESGEAEENKQRLQELPFPNGGESE